MNILDYFKKVTQIPRPSHHMEQIGEFCLNYARERHLEAEKDAAGNIIIRKSATPGMENVKPVILQAHLDMVAEKNPGVSVDFEKDAIKIVEDEEYIYADGTTLGADDGIGVAYALALLDGFNGNLDGEARHPALEVILTTDEETGMDGAKMLDMSKLNGSVMISMDHDSADNVIIGCAGGRRLHYKIPVQFCMTENNSYTIIADGLAGGHSGSSIDKERANACIIMGRVLDHIGKKTDYDLSYIRGGSKDNAIPRSCEAKIFTPADEKTVTSLVHDFAETLKSEYAYSDKDINVRVVNNGREKGKTMCAEHKDAVMFFLKLVPNGVYAVSAAPAPVSAAPAPVSAAPASASALIETSLNLGILDTGDSSVYGCISVRSLVGSRKDMISDKVSALIAHIGGSVEACGDYPEWEYNDGTELLKIFRRTYEEFYGRNLSAIGIHAGLECGYFAKKMPHLEIVSMGPDIFDIHTTKERLCKKSAVKTYDYLLTVLGNIK